MLALPLDMKCVLTGLCRVCASDEQPLTQIFNADGTQQKLQIKIEVCLRIVVREGDVLPTEVCESCARSLDITYELVQRCLRGQEELTRRLAASTCDKLEGKPSSTDNAQASRVEHGKCMEGESDSDTEPQLQRLHILDPHLSSEPQSLAHSVCRHSHSSRMEDECKSCGSLGVLVEAVERMQESQTPGTSRTQADASPTTSASTSATSPATKKRQLSCEFCAKEFHHTGDLNKHRRSHTGERPYSCLDCGKKFSHVSNLRRHRKLHSGERPYSCPACQRSFSRRDKMLSHNCAAARAQPNQSNS